MADTRGVVVVDAPLTPAQLVEIENTRRVLEEMEATSLLCDGGCSLWDCGRPAGHPGPCFPVAPWERA